jgi:hypothetical protein
MPKGTQPLRIVVDPITGQYIEATNRAVAEGSTVFRMGELL